MPKALNTVKVKDSDLTKVQDNLVKFARELGKIEILNGHPIKDILLTPNWTKVSHGLGRLPVGCFVTTATANVVIVCYLSNPADLDSAYLPTREHMYLWCTDVRTDRRASVWVY